MMLNAFIITGKRLEDTVGESVKVRIKPEYFHEVILCLPYQMDYNADMVFEAVEYFDGLFLYGKVFHKKVFDMVEEEADMARDNITDKSSPPKSEWFGFKYKVNPETSKLLQEAVFKDGGGWGYTLGKNLAHTDQPFLVVRENKITFSNDEHYFETCVFLPEKQPPQPEKVFKVGKWYKCVEGSPSNGLQLNNYYELLNGSTVSEGLRFKGECDGCYWSKSRFDISSESDYDPNAKKVVAKDVEESKLDNIVQVTITRSTDTNNFMSSFLTTKEDINIMSNQNRVVSVKFFDDDAGLKAEHSLVAEYQVTTRVSDQMTISKVLLTEDVAGDIELHNGIRANTVDLHILKQTGNKVMLQPVEFEDLRVEVRQV